MRQTSTPGAAPPPARPSPTAAGRIHSAAVTDDGRLFTWGGGLHGRLGLDDFASMSEPCEVQFFADEGLRVLDIACGLDHTLVLAEELP